jgi:hypothetical protein
MSNTDAESLGERYDLPIRATKKTAPAWAWEVEDQVGRHIAETADGECARLIARALNALAKPESTTPVQQLTEQQKLGVIRDFLTPHVQCNVDRMSLDDLHSAVDALAEGSIPWKE